MTPGKEDICRDCEHAVRSMEVRARMVALERREGVLTADIRAAKDTARDTRVQLGMELARLAQVVADLSCGVVSLRGAIDKALAEIST